MILILLISGCSVGSSDNFLEDLKNDNVAVRKNAISDLAGEDIEVTVPLLIQDMKEESSKEVRLAIIDALVEINSIGIFEKLIKKIQGNEENSKEYDLSVNALLGLLHDRDNDIRMSAIDALGEIEAADAVFPLGVLLSEEDRLIKLNVLRALRNIKDDKAVTAINLLLDNEDEIVKYNALQALRRIGEDR